MNKERITKDEYILEVIKDDLTTGRYPSLQESALIIKNANLLSDEENQTRLKLIRNNGAFDQIFEIVNFTSFYKVQFNQKEFLELFWCPKGPKKEIDSIDLMTEGTRRLSKLLCFLKNNSAEKIPNDQKEFFSKCLEKRENIKIFLFETLKGREVIDGCHRSGAILKSLTENVEDGIFPITVYVARMDTSLK